MGDPQGEAKDPHIADIQASCRITGEGVGTAWWRLEETDDAFLLSLAPTDEIGTVTVQGPLSMTVGELLATIRRQPDSRIVTALFGRKR